MLFMNFICIAEDEPYSWPLTPQEATTTIASQEECMQFWFDGMNDGNVCIFSPNEGITACSVSIQATLLASLGETMVS